VCYGPESTVYRKSTQKKKNIYVSSYNLLRAEYKGYGKNNEDVNMMETIMMYFLTIG
jgi:hypothetical protein